LMSPPPIKEINTHKNRYQNDSEHGDDVGDSPHT
jgi:hypothetical protein